jgi:hypothetical protein
MRPKLFAFVLSNHLMRGHVWQKLLGYFTGVMRAAPAYTLPKGPLHFLAIQKSGQLKIGMVLVRRRMDENEWPQNEWPSSSPSEYEWTPSDLVSYNWALPESLSADAQGPHLAPKRIIIYIPSSRLLAFQVALTKKEGHICENQKPLWKRIQFHNFYIYKS